MLIETGCFLDTASGLGLDLVALLLTFRKIADFHPVSPSLSFTRLTMHCYSYRDVKPGELTVRPIPEETLVRTSRAKGLSCQNGDAQEWQMISQEEVIISILESV